MGGVHKRRYSEDVILYERSLAGIDWSPERVATHFGMSCDDGYDDLDDFTILILELEGQGVAFYRHKGDPPNTAFVCDVDRVGPERLFALVGRLLPSDGYSLNVFEEPW